MTPVDMESAVRPLLIRSAMEGWAANQKDLPNHLRRYPLTEDVGWNGTIGIPGAE